MDSARGSDIVKSVGRVFEVLELFERERRPLAAITITRKLKYPASSTIGVLKSMVKLGYLYFDPVGFSYVPTPRLSFLAKWLEAAPNFDVDLISLLDEVVDATEETAAIVCENDIYIQYLRIKRTHLPIAYQVSEGQQVPIFQSTAGLTLLSTKTDVEIVRIAEQINKRGGSGSTVDLRKFLPSIRRFRSTGMGLGYDLFVLGLGLFSWPLKVTLGNRPLVLSIGGPTSRMKPREQEIVLAVNGLLRKHELKYFQRQ